MDLNLLPSVVRFGVFELDLRARELRKNGLSTGLPEQSIKILALLLENPGELVLREEIRKKLWPNDTVVEFDHSINAAIKRLRQALGDPAESPQYIETLPRRGYRWKIPAEWVEAQPEAGGSVEVGGVQIGTAVGGNLIGKKVSHYRVLEVLGGGGMGVVFKAEDLKLGRRVALKFLPEETASDPQTLRRFEQEAQATSALNHPNICTIYEIEEHDGQPFIVMEFLEGETLRELVQAAKTRTAPLPLEKLLDLATQITEGLDAAHQKGIIHRDIKPANVFVTTQGQAKILDFGLAKLVPVLVDAEACPGLENRPNDVHGMVGETTLVQGSDLSLSRTGVAMGTTGYMSPEQVRGEKLDARTDLFSFGLVLYEMAAGQRAFTGETASVVHDAILRHTPRPVREVNPELPSKLGEIIKKALEKDREVRYQTAAEIRADLETLKQQTERKHPAHWREIAAGGAVLLIASAILWFARHQSSPTQTLPDLKFRQLTVNSFEKRVTSGAISPDGKYLAYADIDGMYIKLIDSGETWAVPQPEAIKNKNVEWEIVSTSWFPDCARFLANAHPSAQDSDLWSSQDTSIWMVSVLGGAPHKLRDKAVAYSVSPDGSAISFGTNKGKRRAGDRDIWLMAPSGEQARKLIDTPEGSSIFGLSWAADGRQFVYSRIDESGLSLLSRGLQGGPVVTLLPPSETKKIENFSSWLPDGRLIYSVREFGDFPKTCNYWTMRLDLRTGQVIEKPRRLTNWSGACVSYASLTADGKRLTFLKSAGHVTSYMADLAAGGTRIFKLRHFPLSESSDGTADWTTDSKEVILVSNRAGDFGIYRQPLDGETAKPLVTEGYGRNPRVTPDGKWILYFGLGDPGERLKTRPQPVTRVPIGGGQSQPLFTAKPWSIMSCARPPSEMCVIFEPTQDYGQCIVTAIDPLRGRGPELTRFVVKQNENDWWVDLSPDGTRVAATPDPAGLISILSLRGQPTQQIQVKGWSNLQAFSWTADGKGLFAIDRIRSGDVLLHVDLHGNAQSLWENVGASGETLATASPDGRHVAMSGWTADANIWMMEHF